MTKNGHRELLSYDEIARDCAATIPSIDLGNSSADKIPQKMLRTVKKLLPNQNPALLPRIRRSTGHNCLGLEQLLATVSSHSNLRHGLNISHPFIKWAPIPAAECYGFVILIHP